MVLGQHFFNLTTDVTQTFHVEKYIPYPLYSVFNPSDHDLGESAQATWGRSRACSRARAGKGRGWAPEDLGRVLR